MKYKVDTIREETARMEGHELADMEGLCFDELRDLLEE